MNEILIVLTIFYFIPVVLSVILNYLDDNTKTIGDFIEHFWFCITPVLNIFYIVSLIVYNLLESDKWEKFKKIKINRTFDRFCTCVYCRCISFKFKP